MALTRFARYAWGTLGYTGMVILWGAFVRATGSGAGCANTWPLCDGELVPRPDHIATLIEYTHRASSGIAFLLVLGLAIWAFRRFAPGHRVRRSTALAVLFMITESLIGAGLVVFELVADNASIARALWMAAHLGNTLVLLAALALTAWWSSGGGPLRLRAQGWLAGGLGLSLLGLALASTSGAVAALGDTLFPAESLRQALAQDLSPTAHILIRLRLLHPALAIGASVAVLVITMAAAQARPTPLSHRLSRGIAALVIAQLGVGALNVALLAPIPIQLLHLLMADGIWIGLVLLSAETLSESAFPEPTSGSPAPEGSTSAAR